MTTATTGGVTSTYTYAGADQKALLTESTPARTYNLSYGKNDAQGNPQIATYTINGGGGAHVYSDPITGQALMLTTSADIDSIYVWDGLGNPVGLLTDYATNAFSYSYDPYGTQVLTAGGTGNGTSQNPYSFKAGIQDRASGLVKFGIRWYNPTTGTWTQQDTLDTPLNPHNANRYAYAANDPINNIDPSGTITCSQFASGSSTIGTTLGFVAFGLGVFTGGTAIVAAAGVGAVGVIIGAPGYVIGGLQFVGLIECP